MSLILSSTSTAIEQARRLVFAWVGSFLLKTDRSKMDVGFQAQKQQKANGVLKYFFTKRSEY